MWSASTQPPMSDNVSSSNPRIVVVAVGNAATDALRSLIPLMPHVTFISYANRLLSRKDQPSQPAYDYNINNMLKYRVNSGSRARRWKGKPLAVGDEIWYWEDIGRCGGTFGWALVRDGNVVDTKLSGFVN